MKIVEVFDVNDIMLSLLRKIRFENVLSVLKPVLEPTYFIEQISFVWLKFAKNNEVEQNLRSLKDDGSHAVFWLLLRQDDKQMYGIYLPLSGKLYVITRGRLSSVKPIVSGEFVRFVLKYTSFKDPFSKYTTVRRKSRCFMVQKRWFKNELQLCAKEDRLEERDVICNEGIALENAFYVESQSENFNSYKAMYFRSIEDE